MKLFKKIRDALKKTRDSFSQKLAALFTANELDEDFYEELEDILVSSDIGINVSLEIISSLKLKVKESKIKKVEDCKNLLKEVLTEILEETEDFEFKYPCVITVVGVNGVGKTTSIGKLANNFKENKKSVMLVAGDTFRAAATEQLTTWADRCKIKIVKQDQGADAASVVFDGASSAKAKNIDVLIVDTAGRLQTKTNLMQELGKIDRVIDKAYSGVNKYTLIALDATTGQNALNQITVFNDYVKLDGIILTKLDGTAKGGVVLNIAKSYSLPVKFVGVGEGIDDLETFDKKDFVNGILE